ncbi:MAG: hypothetical protein QOD32_478 [Pyrinomonadaceae bacterium]|nr:hypothetical protein [Pyrinomonadaceae bacterium]
MNAAGVMVVLTQISSSLEMPHFKSLVSDGSISQGEFDEVSSDENGERNLTRGLTGRASRRLVAYRFDSPRDLYLRLIFSRRMSVEGCRII